MVRIEIPAGSKLPGLWWGKIYGLPGLAMGIAGPWFFIMICRDLVAHLGRFIDNLAPYRAGPARMAGAAAS
jgi:hypothetical protein